MPGIVAQNRNKMGTINLYGYPLYLFTVLNFCVPDNGRLCCMYVLCYRQTLLFVICFALI